MKNPRVKEPIKNCLISVRCESKGREGGQKSLWREEIQVGDMSRSRRRIDPTVSAYRPIIQLQKDRDDG